MHHCSNGGVAIVSGVVAGDTLINIWRFTMNADWWRAIVRIIGVGLVADQRRVITVGSADFVDTFSSCCWVYICYSRTFRSVTQCECHHGGRACGSVAAGSSARFSGGGNGGTSLCCLRNRNSHGMNVVCANTCNTIM